MYKSVHRRKPLGKILRYHTKAELHHSNVVHHEDKFSDMITYLSSYASYGVYEDAACVKSLKRYVSHKGNVQSNGSFILTWEDHHRNMWTITSIPIYKGDYQYTVLDVSRNEQTDWITRKEVQTYLKVSPTVLREHLDNGSLHPINGHLVQLITRYRNWSTLLQESLTAPKILSTPRDTLSGIINDVSVGLSKEETIERLTALLHRLETK